MCKKAHEENGSSWKGELPKEMLGHIQCAGCLGQKEVVTAAHNACIRELLQAIDMHGKTDRHMYFLFLQERIKDIIIKLLTIEKESRVHSGIKNSVHRFALRRNCGKQRKRKK